MTRLETLKLLLELLDGLDCPEVDIGWYGGTNVIPEKELIGRIYDAIEAEQAKLPPVEWKSAIIIGALLPISEPEPKSW